MIDTVINNRTIKYIVAISIALIFLSCKPPTNNNNSDNNNSPVISSFSHVPNNVLPQDTLAISVTTEDTDGDIINITWYSSFGKFLSSIDSSKVLWTAGNDRGDVYIGVKATDGFDTVKDSIKLHIQSRPLTIELLSPARTLNNYQNVVNNNELAQLTFKTPDLNSEINILWSSDYGTFIGNTNQDTALWNPNGSSKYIEIKLDISDNIESVSEEIRLYVNTPPTVPELLYPINDKIIGTTEIVFMWESSDPDFEDLNHNLKYSIDGINFNIISTIEESYYKPDDIQHGDQVLWSLESVDNNGLVSELNEGAFRVDTLQSNNFNLGGNGEFINMLLIPHGKYFRGAPNEIGAGSDEVPVKEITIPNDLWLSKFEVTQKQWSSIMGPWNFGGFTGDSLPACNFTFNDAKVFISRLNDFEGDSLWRLPTEAEWEYACRANHFNGRYFWGDDLNNSYLRFFGWYDYNSGSMPHIIGSTTMKIPNPWGFWDMQGNAYEMCEDYYHYDYNTAPTDGTAQLSSFDNTRVIRGGTWAADSRRLRAAHRSWLLHGNKADVAGIRLVRLQK